MTQKVLTVLFSAMLLFVACKPTPREPVSIEPAYMDSIPRMDTVPTVIVSQDTAKEDVTYPISIDLGSGGLKLISSHDRIDKLGKVTSIYVEIEHDSIVLLKVNNDIALGDFGESDIQRTPKYYCSYHIDPKTGKAYAIAKEGATLEYIARMYGKTIPQLKSYNPSITNPNKIRVGSKINLDCYCE